MRRHATSAPRWSSRFIALNSVFVVALISVGAFAAWPIYQSPSFVILVAVSTAVAALISVLGLVFTWSWFRVLLVSVGAYLVLGVPLAVPSALTGPAAVAPALMQFISATVFGWKQLVTVTIPVGTYQGLLVPALVLFLFGSVAAFSLAWRAKRLYLLVAPILLALPLFGLAFGSSRLGGTVSIVGRDVAVREFAIGILSMLLSLAFLLWRARSARRRALRAGAVSITRQSRANVAGAIRRAALGVAMLLVALVVAAAVVPPAEGGDRHVLRTAIEPYINLNEFVSPLTQYRSYFSAENYDTELFALDGDARGARLRLAVLRYYDGEVYRMTDPTAGDEARDTAFARIPSTLHPEMAGAAVSVEVEVGAYSGAWIPTVGSLTSIAFHGSAASALTDGFYYNEDVRSGVQLALLRPGDGYTVTAVTADEVRLASLSRPDSSIGLVDPALLPESLKTWVDSQALATDAASLQKLIDRLRARGYLSHALVEPTGEAARWVADLGDYSFEPSLAGHSVGRIEAMFDSLVEKQNDTQSRSDADLVAAVGDDEQFAVAAALIAQYLGFPARVVLGFELGSVAPNSTPCKAGSCQGRHLKAWVEVQGADGEWATADVSPQHENPVTPLDNEQQDPENLTEVVPETASEVAPPVANPNGGEQAEQSATQEAPDLAMLVAALKVAGAALLSMLVVIAPFLTVLIAKARRRRARVGAPDVESRIVGGWDEYVDTALDHGKPAPTSETRVELARVYGTPRALVLATMADRAVFHAAEPAHELGDEFWAIVEAECRSMAAGQSRWQRIRTAVSLRSFVPQLQAQRPARPARARKKSSMTIGQTTVRA